MIIKNYVQCPECNKKYTPTKENLIRSLWFRHICLKCGTELMVYVNREAGDPEFKPRGGFTTKKYVAR